MNKLVEQTQDQWAEAWLDSVSNGGNTMSQRKLTSINKQGGGIEVVKQIAKKKGVHLLQITDDKGNELVAASVNPFMVLC